MPLLLLLPLSLLLLLLLSLMMNITITLHVSSVFPSCCGAFTLEADYCRHRSLGEQRPKVRSIAPPGPRVVKHIHKL
jgi:hypothetical protein